MVTFLLRLYHNFLLAIKFLYNLICIENWSWITLASLTWSPQNKKKSFTIVEHLEK